MVCHFAREPAVPLRRLGTRTALLFPCVSPLTAEGDRTVARKYSENAQEKIGAVMHEFKQGKLKSSSGQKVTNRKQAVAIGLSEARKDGLKVPNRAKAERS